MKINFSIQRFDLTQEKLEKFHCTSQLAIIAVQGSWLFN
jgi:hypothetical protein